jgi:hypothetical protein
MTIPGEQNPHCDAPEATKQSAHSSRSASDSPSWVTTLRPSACPAFWAHDTTALPSTSTVQAPQEPSGAQPSFTDVAPHTSRSSSSRLMPGRTSASTGAPFSVNRTAATSWGHSTPPSTSASRAIRITTPL